MLPLSDFLNFGKKNNLFFTNDKVLLAVSGGKDSVLMAHFFHEAKIEFAIAHCNFQLRVEESARDAKFVEDLAKQFKVPFYIQYFDTKNWAKSQHISTQLAARNLRYKWFETLKNEYHFSSIAIAHHQNDVAETMLFNLSRGAGLAGLHGILPRNQNIIRPLLFLNSTQINQLVCEHSISFVEDSSNQSNAYSRNQIRHICVPALEQINAETVVNMARTAEIIRQYESLIRDFLTLNRSNWTEKSKDGVLKIFSKKFKSLNYASTVAYELLKEFKFERKQIASILNESTTGAKFHSATHILFIERNEWHVLPFSELTTQNNEVEIHEFQSVVQLNSYQIQLQNSENISISYEKNKVHLDYEKLIFPLKLRVWQHGDQIKPMGMNKMKKISDVFIDTKTPLYEKQQIPLLVNNDGRIIWIVGKIIHNDFKITKNTKKMLILALQ